MRLNEISKSVNVYRKVKVLRFSLRAPLTCQVWGNEGKSANKTERSSHWSAREIRKCIVLEAR